MNKKLSFFLLFFIMVVAVLPGLAQDEQEGDNSLLPDIDPQDIEIRSEFQARFPGLNRQPILGFDPSPRVYQIDPNRMPFMESEDQVVASLPVSELTRPDPPFYSPFDYSEKINALARIGVGSFISPEAQFWGVKRLTRQSYVGGDLDFTSSDGHLDSQESSYRFFDASGEFATKLGKKTRLNVTGGLENSFNRMFNLDPAVNIPDDALKEYKGFHLGGELEHFKNNITGWNVTSNLRYFAPVLNAGSISGESDELVYQGSIAKRWAGPNVQETITVKAGVKGGHYENTVPFSENWTTGQAGLAYERLINYTTEVTADASIYYGVDEFNSKVYLGPSLTVEHPIQDVLSIKAKVEAAPFVRTAEQLHHRNRFLNTSNPLRHSYRMSGLAEAEIDFEEIGALTMGVEYENISDYPVFTRDVGSSPIGIPQQYFYTTSYQDIYRIKAYAGVSHQIIANRFWLQGKAYVQSPQIENGGRIPYEERLGVQSTIGVRPIDQITLKAWADYTGSRESSLSGQDLNGYILLGGRLDVYLTDKIGAYVKLKNLLNQDYQVWSGYMERPFQAYGGVILKL